MSLSVGHPGFHGFIFWKNTIIYMQSHKRNANNNNKHLQSAAHFWRVSLCCFQYRRLGMLAAGTGIAPMLQVIQGILSNEDDETFIHLVYSSQAYEEILMKHSLDEMKAYWNFSVLYVVSKVSSSSKLTEFEYSNLKHRVISDHVKFVCSFYRIVFLVFFFLQYNYEQNYFLTHTNTCTCTWILHVNTMFHCAVLENIHITGNSTEGTEIFYETPCSKLWRL